MARMASRGAFIILEGCDKCGKTTQCKKLVDTLTEQGIPVKLWRFPGKTWVSSCSSGSISDRKMPQNMLLVLICCKMLKYKRKFQSTKGIVRYTVGTTEVQIFGYELVTRVLDSEIELKVLDNKSRSSVVTFPLELPSWAHTFTYNGVPVFILHRDGHQHRFPYT